MTARKTEVIKLLQAEYVNKTAPAFEGTLKQLKKSQMQLVDLVKKAADAVAAVQKSAAE